MFTIGIPAYKSAFLKECIESILAQTVKDFELIIINDASPENLDEIVNSFSDKRIRYFKNETNVGAINVIDNWNKCLSYAKGEFLICMGDDDKLLPNCLEVYLNLIDKYPCLDILHAWTEIIDENSSFIRLQEARPEYESVYSLMWHRFNGRVQFIGDFLFRTSELKAKGGFYKMPLAWASDDITSFILANDKGIANSQIPIFQYRVNSRTISKTGNVQEKMHAISLESKWYETFLKLKTSNDIDNKFKEMLINELPLYIIKKKIFRVKIDLVNGSITRIIYWVINRQKFEITISAIIKGLLDALPICLGIVPRKRF